MKNIYIFVLLLLFFKGNAQIGIGTELPLSKLHVTGSMQITEDIKVSSKIDEKGDSGLYKQVLTSQGNAQTLKWSKIEDVLVDKPDGNSYTLANVYNAILKKETLKDKESKLLSTLEKVKIDFDENFIVIKFSCYLNFTKKFAYSSPVAKSVVNFTVLRDGVEWQSSPDFHVSNIGFNSITFLASSSLNKVNETKGISDFTLKVNRVFGSGQMAKEDMNLNAAGDSGAELFGTFTIYVYEKMKY